ncbi:hypothetical protein, partial [Rubrivirga sp.]|uniref:hypothetical protein n=1 Tax=Rubrivirga sp. TaxID=1885344 RepID=UPI003C776D43
MRALILLSALVAGCGGSALEVGSTLEGELTTDDPAFHPGQPSDEIPARLEVGEPVVVLVTSTAFAPFVIVTSPEAPMGVSASDETGAGACLTLEAPMSPDVRIYVSGLEVGDLGPYRVSLEPYSDVLAQAHGCGVLEDGVETLTASSTTRGTAAG